MSSKGQDYIRLRGTMRPYIANTTDAFDGPEMPFSLASSVALGVLSSAADVGGREGLLRGHDVCCFPVAADLAGCRISYRQLLYEESWVVLVGICVSLLGGLAESGLQIGGY